MKRNVAWITLLMFVWGHCVSAYAQTGASLVWGVNRGGQIWRWTGNTWQPVPGGLKQVSVGADGAVWGVNAADEIWRWTGNTWQPVPGKLSQISVGSAQHVWGVNARGNIYRWTGNAWQQMSGGLKQVAVGADGAVWGVAGNGAIWRWSGSTWQRMPGRLAQISVGSALYVWGVNAADDIWRWTGNAWQQMSGKLSHVAVAGDGTVWGVSRSGNIYHWSGNQWQQVPGGLAQIAVAAPWQVAVPVSPLIASPSSGSSNTVSSPPVAPGGMPQVMVVPPRQAAAPGGSVVVSPPVLSNTISSPPAAPGGSVHIGGASPGQASATTGALTVSTLPAPSQPLPVSSQPLTVSGLKWRASQTPAAGGSLVCSRGNIQTCGTTPANYVGSYAFNMKCDSGFFDPIWGGTCWKCPDDTDNGGRWIRSATKVTDDDACWRAPRERTTRATLVKGPPTAAWHCASGTFWDGFPPGGACWQCPDTHPRRTAAPVYAHNACATPMNETRPAVFINYNGCPKPDAAQMQLAGKRLPGKPFPIDIVGGGCYACPVTDEQGHILITARKAGVIHGDRPECDILFNWKPHPFPEPGMSGLAGVKGAIIGSNLLDSDGLTMGLYLLAESRGMARNTPAARDWVAAQWREIASAPYRNEAFRTLVYLRLLLVAKALPAEHTPGDAELLRAFEEYINARRVYMAQMGLAMYDAWKAHDDRTRQLYARSQLLVAFDYGTVPLDFHTTLGTTMTLGATGLGTLGAIAAAQKIAATAQWGWKPAQGGKMMWTAVPSTTLHGTLGKMRALQILRFANVTANAAMLGAAVISIAGIILQSIAIEQFMAIVTARPKLEAALEQARQPVTLGQILDQTNGSDQAVYFWAKAMEVPSEQEDPQLVALAAAAHQQAQATGYQLRLASAP